MKGMKRNQDTTALRQMIGLVHEELKKTGGCPFRTLLRRAQVDPLNEAERAAVNRVRTATVYLQREKHIIRVPGVKEMFYPVGQ